MNEMKICNYKNKNCNNGSKMRNGKEWGNRLCKNIIRRSVWRREKKNIHMDKCRSFLKKKKMKNKEIKLREKNNPLVSVILIVWIFSVVFNLCAMHWYFRKKIFSIVFLSRKKTIRKTISLMWKVSFFVWKYKFFFVTFWPV